MDFRTASCEAALTEVDGQVRIAGTRVSLDTVVNCFQQGATAEEIVQDYPSLDLGKVYAVIGFYLQHREAVEAYLRIRDDFAGKTEQENRRRFAGNGLRDRLRARQLPPVRSQ